MPDPSRIRRTVELLRAVGEGPVTVAEVLASSPSTTSAALRAAVAGGAVTRLRKGIIVPSADWTAADEHLRRIWALRAATTAWSGSFGSHDTAALLWGLPDYRVDVAGDPPRTHITRVGRARIDDWIRIHGCDTSTDAVAHLGGVPVTGIVRTAVDMSATRSLRASVVHMDAAMRRAIALEVGESAVRRAATDAAVRARVLRMFDEGVAPYTRHRWVTHVRMAIRWADPAAETVLESLSRVAMRENAVPPPRCGVPLVGDDDRTYWVDFYWEDAGLIGEADGLGKYADTSVLVQEKRREEALVGRGYRFVRWGMDEVRPDPQVLVRRLRHALATRPDA